jgi:hypothetical protein
MASDVCLTGLLTVGRNITLTFTWLYRTSVKFTATTQRLISLISTSLVDVFLIMFSTVDIITTQFSEASSHRHH